MQNTLGLAVRPEVALIRSTLAKLERQLADGAYGAKREALVIAIDVCRKKLAAMGAK